MMNAPNNARKNNGANSTAPAGRTGGKVNPPNSPSDKPNGTRPQPRGGSPLNPPNASGGDKRYGTMQHLGSMPFAPGQGAVPVSTGSNGPVNAPSVIIRGR